MTTAISPWPPTDPTAALPFDQRGCCWPWGQWGPREKMAMRYMAIGERDAGPVGPTWNQWVTGQMLLVDLVGTTIGNYQAQGAPSTPLVFRDTFQVSFNPTLVAWQGSMQSILTIIPSQSFAAGGSILTAAPFDSFRLPVFFSNGGADPPDRIVLTPLHWYSVSPFPWLG